MRLDSDRFKRVNTEKVTSVSADQPGRGAVALRERSGKADRTGEDQSRYRISKRVPRRDPTGNARASRIKVHTVPVSLRSLDTPSRSS